MSGIRRVARSRDKRTEVQLQENLKASTTSEAEQYAEEAKQDAYQYADQQANQAKQDANDYTDSAASTAEDNAKSYADQQANQAKVDANDYTDTHENKSNPHSGSASNDYVDSLVNLGGPTADRPTTPDNYMMYFDTDLGHPIWYDGTDWVDSQGTVV